MYTARKNNKNMEVINILVYAENVGVLWEYRNLLQEIKLENSYMFKLTLTSRSYTVLEQIKLMRENVDIYLSYSTVQTKGRFLTAQIREKYPECHIIQRKEKGYYHEYHVEDDIYLEEVWLPTKKVLKDKIIFILKKIVGKSEHDRSVKDDVLGNS